MMEGKFNQSRRLSNMKKVAINKNADVIERRVLFIASDNDSAHGAFRSMVVLCKLLRDDYNVKPIVLLRTKKGTGIELLESMGISYKVIKSYNWIIPIDYRWTFLNKVKWILKKVVNLWAILQIVYYAKKERIDGIHINTTYTYVGLYASKIIGKPCIWHIREMLEEDQNKKFAFCNANLIMNQSTRTVAISDFVFQKYSKNLANIITIYNGIDENKYYLHRHIFETDIVQILLIGNMNANKGHFTLIHAIRIILERGYRKIHVNFVGSGQQEKKFRDLVRELDMDKYFTFYGYQKEVRKFYAKTDIMIMASLAEAFGRTTVEAMMAGCLVIGAECGATPEVLDYGRAGMLYHNEDSFSLADKIIKAIDNREKASSIALNGQNYALKHFTAKENASKVYELYKETGVIRGGV